MKKWWTLPNDLPVLNDVEKRRIEYITGGIPLLLRPLIGLGREGKHFKAVEPTFLNSPELQAVAKNVHTFMDSKYAKEMWDG